VTEEQIRFDDGAGYERYMGAWSQLVGETFLDWLVPAAGVRWLDIGCGNGAFTELVATRCLPSSIDGIDPAAQQVEYARTRPLLREAKLQVGDAMALPFDNDCFDVAVMPLVIFFVPDPAQGVAEMRRVLRTGGIAGAYAWDMEGGGFPYAMLQEEMRKLDVTVPQAPSMSASHIDVMRKLWIDAGFKDIQVQQFTVDRIYPSFDEYWKIVLGGPSVGGKLRALDPEKTVQLQARMRARLAVDASGGIASNARANAVKGVVG
jgi:ubiquinone/menaquinone biosynthesis C-methylase UbiE